MAQRSRCGKGRRSAVRRTDLGWLIWQTGKPQLKAFIFFLLIDFFHNFIKSRNDIESRNGIVYLAVILDFGSRCWRCSRIHGSRHEYWLCQAMAKRRSKGVIFYIYI